jgi:preprotein translocase subunit YajC
MSNNNFINFINIILLIFFLWFVVFLISNKLKRMNKIKNYLNI